MIRFIHAADIHLDSPLHGLERYEGAPVEALRGATRAALERMVDLALEEEVDLVLVAGDLFDGDWRDFNTGLFWLAQVSRLREAGIPVVVVAGNHDAASQVGRSLRPPDNLHVLSTRSPETLVLDDLGVAVHGQGYPRRAVTENLALSYPDPVPGLLDVGLLHTSVTGRPGHEPYAPCAVSDLVSRGYGYWALGHVHQREVLSEDPWIVFPGNPQGRHARETGPRGCTLVTAEGDRVVSVEHRDLDVVRWAVCPVDASGVTTRDGVLDRVEEALGAELDALAGQSLAVRVRVEGASEAHRALASDPEGLRAEVRALATDLGGGRVWVEKVQVRTEAPADLELAVQRDDALGGLLRSVRDLQADDALLAEHAGVLEDLRARLPAELREGAGGLDLDDPDTLRSLVEEARQILLASLLGRGGDR